MGWANARTDRAPLSADAWLTCQLSFFANTPSFRQIPDRKYSWLDKRNINWSGALSLADNEWLQINDRFPGSEYFIHSFLFSLIKSVTFTSFTVVHIQQLIFHSIFYNGLSFYQDILKVGIKNKHIFSLRQYQVLSNKSKQYQRWRILIANGSRVP